MGFMGLCVEVAYETVEEVHVREEVAREERTMIPGPKITIKRISSSHSYASSEVIREGGGQGRTGVILSISSYRF
jgi:hypothetical protein